MSMINLGVMAVHSGLIFGWNEAARRPATTLSALENRDIASVVIFCAVGLIASLLFVRFVPGGVSALIALMP